MYLGLFLAPWVLMYAASTAVMNHREFVQSFYQTKAPAMVKERELDFSRTFRADASRENIAKEILQALGLEGTHRVSGGDGKPVVIERQHAWVPRRITWNPATARVLIEKQEYRTAAFLERMHRRRGYQHPYGLDDTWALSVDLAMLACAFWCVSGVWLWWELRSTRLWGAACAGFGAGVFLMFLILL